MEDKYELQGCPWTTIKRLVQDPQWPFSEGSMRYWLFHAKENGLQHAVKRLGKKVLIHKGRLLEWLENYQNDTRAKHKGGIK
jgi:uncharacterized protein (DUF927 family)